MATRWANTSIPLIVCMATRWADTSSPLIVCMANNNYVSCFFSVSAPEGEIATFLLNWEIFRAFSLLISANYSIQF